MPKGYYSGDIYKGLVISLFVMLHDMKLMLHFVNLIVFSVCDKENFKEKCSDYTFSLTGKRRMQLIM